MCVSCSRSLASLSMGSASTDKSPSQLLKLCLRFASSMVMIWRWHKLSETGYRSQIQKVLTISELSPNTPRCLLLWLQRGGGGLFPYCTHLPATRCRVTEEVVNHVQLIFLHQDKALFSSLLPVHVRRPLDEKRVQMVHPETDTVAQPRTKCWMEYKHSDLMTVYCVGIDGLTFLVGQQTSTLAVYLGPQINEWG